jgi:hypothetical protein
MSVLINNHKSTEDIKILFTFTMCHCSNYNTFVQTVVLNLIILIPSVYYMAQAQLSIRYDPYPEINEDGTYYFKRVIETDYLGSQMWLYIAVYLAFCMHHYLIQKDLLTITIEKQMIIS